jgi:iron complex transport system substrate-binding protein
MCPLSLAVLIAVAPGAAVHWRGTPPPRPPARLATLAPSLTEMVIALGEGKRLVGVSRYDDAAQVHALPRLGGMIDPSPESVLAVKPGALLVQPAPGAGPVLERVAALGVPVLELQLATVADVEQAERTIGALLGVPERGEALAHALEVRMTRAQLHARGRTHPRVLLVYGWSPLVVAGPGAFADELLSACGGENVAHDARAAYTPYSAEAAALARPELILDLTFDEKMPATLRTAPGFKEARLVRPHSQALLHPGPRLVEGLDELEAALQSAP